MQIERLPQHTPQEIQVVKLVPEQGVAAMQQAIITMLLTLPTPITIMQHKDTKRQKTYYTYQVGEQTDRHPIGYAKGETPDFLDAMRSSLEAVMRQGQDEY